ncbi:hypothetical protein INT45_002315 [Circinella minor]|uniref:Uncharacterized protein n=1 Tax=Circinella minor TaxID=1195481 RepID=A0A8H7RRF9_9FUNG|nr:hypothetical protein INT45_002315 [Circinella minor]
MHYVGFSVDVAIDVDVAVAGDDAADQVYSTVFVIEFLFLLLLGFDSYRFRPFSVLRFYQVLDNYFVGILLRMGHFQFKR